MIHERASQIVIFHSLVISGSFTDAARTLGVSTSHVSKQLAILEKELNIQLLQRTTRKISLTEAGRDYFECSKKIVSAITDAENSIETNRDEVVGTLRLGLAQSFGTMHIVPAIEQLRQRFPELNVELSLFDHKADMLADNLDIWITNYSQIPEGYVAQRIVDSSFVLAASPDYLIRHQAPVHPQDLAHHNCLTYRSSHKDYSLWAFSKSDEDVSVKVSGNYRVDLAEAVRDATISGWGVAYLATYLLTDEFKQGKLIQLLPDWKANQAMPFYAVYPRRQHLPKKVTTAIHFLKQFIGDPPYWERTLARTIKL